MQYFLHKHTVWITEIRHRKICTGK